MKCMRSDCQAAATVHGVFTWSASDAPSELDTSLSLCREHAAEEDQLGGLHKHFYFVARALCIAVRRPQPTGTSMDWRSLEATAPSSGGV